MSTYLPSLPSLTTQITLAKSRYTSALRQRITTSTSESDDLYIDTPAASHVSRVLRAYYKEKGKQMPEWLGVDPRDKDKGNSSGGNVGGNVGGQGQQQEGKGGYLGSLRRSAASGGGGETSAAATTGRGGLGDIWGDSSGGGGRQDQEGSLRRGVGGGAARVMGRKPLLGGRPDSAEGRSGGGPEGARPLPSQRAGSYQNVTAGSGGAQGGGGSAQDRLRARMAARMGSPSGGSGSGSGSGSWGSGDEGGGRRY
ncbi:MAG: hypothetical protein Q9220_006441 [cf. Caloplaca sp. 1 TL-2023]